jgi:iron(III) transport system ATP-binding protein
VAGLGLALEQVTKRFGATAAVDDVSLALGSAGFTAVLGPSGCGKTTLLRLIAGFERPDAGRILLDGKELIDPPEKRNIGIVFQSYALWPHMSVARNVGYPLEVRRVAREERARRVDAALATVGLTGLGERRPAELSGGQRQRVALARCLVMAPRLVLLDEPLANLDVHLRASLQDEFAAFHRRTGAAMLYITHDQAEAMALADTIAVMDQGRIIQVAKPHDLYRAPATPMVAAFVGRGGLLRAHVIGPASGGRAPVSINGYAGSARAMPSQKEGSALLSVRPEGLRPVRADETGFAATVKRSLYQGGSVAVELVPEGDPDSLLFITMSPDSTPLPGASLRLALDDAWVVPEA